MTEIPTSAAGASPVEANALDRLIRQMDGVVEVANRRLSSLSGRAVPAEVRAAAQQASTALQDVEELLRPLSGRPLNSSEFETVEKIAKSLLLLRDGPLDSSALRDSTVALESAMLHLLDARTAETALTLSEPLARRLAGNVVVRRVEAAKHGFTQQTMERWTLIGCGVIVFLVAVVLVFRLQTQVEPHLFDRGFRHRGAVIAVVSILLLVGIVQLVVGGFRPYSSRRARSDAWRWAYGVLALVLVTLAAIAIWLSQRAADSPTELSPVVLLLFVAGAMPFIAWTTILVGQHYGAYLPEGRPSTEPVTTSVRRDNGAFIDDFGMDIQRRLEAERRAEKRWRVAHYVVGGLAALLAGAAGAAGLSDLGGPLKIILGILGLVGGGLAGVSTTLAAASNADRSEQRRIEYEALLIDLKRFREGHVSDESTSDALAIDDFVARARAISGAQSDSTAQPNPKN